MQETARTTIARERVVLGGWRAARVYCAKRDRARERSDNDIFQNNSLFQGSSFAYEAKQRDRLEEARARERKGEGGEL